MILKETILSAFNKRGTLLKWLKKVEKLLNESTLIEITVEKINSTEAVIKLFFEDNSTIQSDPFNIDNLISNLSLFTEDVELTAGNNVGITITGNSKVNQSNVRAVMRIPIIGSDTVVIDVAEDEEHFEIHLDADIAQKIERSLVKPINRPQATEIVAVDNKGAQVMLGVGSGLSISNGVLNAEGGGGGGGANILDMMYCHMVNSTTNIFHNFIVMNIDPKPITSVTMLSNLPLGLFSSVLDDSGHAIVNIGSKSYGTYAAYAVYMINSDTGVLEDISRGGITLEEKFKDTVHKLSELG